MISGHETFRQAFPGLGARASLKLRPPEVDAAEGVEPVPGPSRPGLIEATTDVSDGAACRCALPGSSRPGLIEAAESCLPQPALKPPLPGPSRPGLIEADGRARQLRTGLFPFPGVRARASLKLSRAYWKRCRNGTTFPGVEDDPDHGSAPRAPIGGVGERTRQAHRWPRTAASTWMRHISRPDDGPAIEARPRASSSRWRRRRRR